MKHKKYFYDKDTNSYIPIRKERFSRLRLVVSVVIVTLFLVAAGGYLAYEKMVQPHNADQAQLAHELERMQLQYKLLNKKFEQTHKVLNDLEERDDYIYRSFFELSPVMPDVRKGGFGGVDRYAGFADLTYGEVVAETTKALDMLNSRIIVHSQSLDEVLVTAKEKEEMFRHMPAIKPVTGDHSRSLVSGYGMRLHPILNIGKMHWGIDFALPTGTPIYATADGKVKIAGSHANYGNTVILEHGYGYETLYAHMHKVQVRPGAKVKRGDVIGTVGNTGLSTGAHLHYEVHKDGEKLNPISFFYQDISPAEFKHLFDQSEKITVSLD
ncbi:MAG: M23 family metallopeptidase [Weeksellaceae bacterium]|nr:M23 family metallopeptidase [Weeksellaceae bacterium]